MSHSGEATAGRTQPRTGLLVAVLAVNLGLAAVHGSTHVMVPVALGPVANGLVLLTTFLGPVVGVVLARRGHPLGVRLFTVSLAAALLLGGVLHFVLETPDHVAVVPAGPWRLPFAASAVALAVVQAVGVAIGAWVWWGR